MKLKYLTVLPLVTTPLIVVSCGSDDKDYSFQASDIEVIGINSRISQIKMKIVRNENHRYANEFYLNLERLDSTEWNPNPVQGTHFDGDYVIFELKEFSGGKYKISNISYEYVKGFKHRRSVDSIPKFEFIIVSQDKEPDSSNRTVFIYPVFPPVR